MMPKLEQAFHMPVVWHPVTGLGQRPKPKREFALASDFLEQGAPEDCLGCRFVVDLPVFQRVMRLILIRMGIIEKNAIDMVQPYAAPPVRSGQTLNMPTTHPPRRRGNRAGVAAVNVWPVFQALHEKAAIDQDCDLADAGHD
ncbi:MAG: hypothetical protein JJU15_19395 [Pararhodobacter sp.]|nr:hypothetical protein [Pararhodobacter sp.]